MIIRISRLTRTNRSLGLLVVFVLIAGFSHAGNRSLSEGVLRSLPPDTTKTGKQGGDSVFNSIVAKGDDYYKKKQFDEALIQYEQALKLHPGDYYLKGKITQVRNVKSELVRTQADYTRTINSADAYFSQQDYLNAKSAYQLALTIRPDDDYATGKLNETLGLLRSQKAKNILYDVTIDSAEKLFAAKDYDKAKEQYENASKILPNEKYPKERINAIIKIQVDNQTRDEMYANSIAAADKYYSAKNWPGALTGYRNALSYKPEEKYPQDRIKELESLLGLQKEKDDAYDKAIAAADKLFAAGTYPDARTGYQGASKIKPDEAYPKKKIREIDDILANRTKMETEYQRLIDAADSLYIAKNYILAKVNYQQALRVKQGESYPKEMISKSDQMLAGQESNAKQMDEAYQAAVASADRSFAAKDYIKAKSDYQNALSIKPGEKYPQDKINEIDAINAALARQKSDDDLYLNTIAAADKLLADKSYDQAKAGYNKALGIRPDQQYPKDQIAFIDKTLGDLAEIAKQKSAELAKIKALNDKYTASIAKADQLFNAKSWEPAKTEYTNASGMKPEEEYPKTKIAEIEKILAGIADQKAKDELYATSITKADKLLADKNYNEAKAEYENAGNIKPDETYPKTQIAGIDKTLAGLADQKAKDEMYAAGIAKADKLLAGKNWEPAKTEYQNALAIKPAEAYPKSKIEEIDKILADAAQQKSLDDQYNNAISAGDKLLAEKTFDQAKIQYLSALKLKPAEQYPKDKIAGIDAALAELSKIKALNDQYAASIAKADQLFNAKSWDLAKTEYTNASGLKPEEEYPKAKIAEIGKILAGIADEKAKDELYAASIAKADKLLIDKNYNEAKAEYQNAGNIRPDETYPKTQIAGIDKVLADIADQKAKDEMYAAGIAKADKLLAGKNWEPAKTEYQNALAIKPAETYPKTKIEEIDKVLADIAKQKALDDQYAGLISEGDKLLSEKSFDASKVKYQAALGLKPGEQYPKGKIAEIDQALADIARLKSIDDQYTASVAAADKLFTDKNWDQAKTGYLNAGKIKPAENYPKDKIAEIDKILAGIAAQKALDDKYAGIIANADKLFDAKSYDPAKTEYTNALNLKPGEQYPKEKLAAIDKINADLAKQKEIDDQYKAIITKADQLFQNKSYDQARTVYMDAGNLKPSEEYPKTRIAAIDKIFSDQKLAELAHQKAIDDQYNTSITKADKYLADKSYQQARAEYTTAQGIKPGEAYPKDKITEIDGILAELKAKNDAYTASITKADQLFVQKNWEDARTEYGNASQIKPDERYPKDKITEINKTLAEIKGKKQTFDDLVAKGDAQFSQKDYYNAKDLFQQSLGLFPDEAYPKARISRINMVVDSIYRINKVFYDKAVAEGDKSYNAFIFDKAIDSYNEALSFLPMESYPKDMISKIKKVISENAIVDILKTTLVIPEGTEKQFPFSPVSMASRKNNYFYIKIRNLSEKPFNVLVRYGKDKQISGGAVLRNLAGDGKTYDRLISVRDQDPWYRIDNNWIGLLPQGGDVEVTFIQISRSQ